MEANFFNTTLFQTVIILIVWFVAIRIYQKQKKDEKRKAARIILMEIRKIESNIKQFKENNKWYHNSIIGNSNWRDLSHHFVDALDRDGLDYINNFYEQCDNAENERLKIEKGLNIAIETKAVKSQEILFEIVKEDINEEDYAKKIIEKKALVDKYINNDSTRRFMPDNAMLKEYLETIRLMSWTLYFEKLKKIAKIKD